MKRRRLCRLLAGLCALVGCYAQVQAQAQPNVQFTVTTPFGENYVPGTWLPLHAVLRNDGAATNVTISVSLPGSPNRYTTQVDLPQGAQKATTLYVAMEQATNEIQVKAEAAGAAFAEQKLTVRPRVGERLLGLVSAEPFTLSLPRRQDLDQIPFDVFSLSLDNIPAQAAGLRAVSAILIRDIPEQGFSPAQQQALVGYVHGGGQLVIGGGTAIQAMLDQLPPAFRLATPGATAQLDVQQLAIFTSTTAPSALAGVQLQPQVGTTIVGPKDAPLWVQRRLGDGLVTQLAFDPALQQLTTWTNAPKFWDRLFRPLTLSPGPFGLELTAESGRDQLLTTAVAQLPAARLPQTPLLLGLLVIYALVIGPGAALVLRRLDRQVLGWVVLPGLALLFLGGSVTLARNLRTDQRVVSQVSLIEQAGPDQARVRTAIGGLAPQDGAFNIQVPDNTLVRPIRPVTGPFGPLEGVSGTWDQTNGTLPMPVQRWKLQGVLAEQQAALPHLDATITLEGVTINARVRNTLEVPLQNVIVAYGRQLARLGDLEPGQEGSALWPFQPTSTNEPPGLDTTLSYLILREQLDKGRGPGGVPEREVLLQEALLNAAVNRGAQAPDQGPWVIAFVPGNLAGVDVTTSGVAKQHMTLLVDRADIQGKGAVGLPFGWLTPDLSTEQSNECTTKGRFMPQTATLTTTLQLPPSLAPLRATSLMLTLTSDRTWPNAGITTELFDYEANKWVDQNFDGPGELPVMTPERYLRRGQVELRLRGKVTDTGCMFVRGRLAGTLP